MSYEKCKSISRLRQTDDGKWTATIFSACNNVRPLDWRKVDFIPQDSKEKLISVILHDLYNGNIHMYGKCPYQSFLDEVILGITPSAAWKKICYYDHLREKTWEISSRHNYWRKMECEAEMEEKRKRICVKCHEKVKAYELDLALEFMQWKPCKTKYLVQIDGMFIQEWTMRGDCGRARWIYAGLGRDGKEFGTIEAHKIQRRLENTPYTVNLIDAHRYKTQGRVA